MFKSILNRLFWTNVAILVMVLASISLGMTAFLTNYVASQQFDMASKAASNIEHLTALLQIENRDYRSDEIYNSTLYSLSQVVNSDITVINITGEVYASTNDIKRVPARLITEVLSGHTITRRDFFGNYYDKKVFIIGIPLKYQNKVAGGIFFNTQLPNMHGTLREYLNMFLLSCIFAILLAFIFVYLQSRRLTAPIKDINNAVLNIASGHFDQRLKVNTPDEIGQLASSFNYMAASLEHLEDMRSQFISDVSHELRTPMTSISGFVQGILDGTIPPERQEEYLKIVRDECQRLVKMTNDMLEMSKMSSSEYKLDVSTFDVNELMRLCIIQLEQKISGKNLELDVNFSAETLNVVADKDAIRRVIINILDNAVKFSYENTKVSISIYGEDGKAYIGIGNFGIGIQESEIKNIFDRFYKTDKSRSDDKKGAGLGLSMVKNIINLHKQHIWVESIDAKEGSHAKFTKFTFTLELA